MIYRNKYHAMRVTQFATFLLVLFGLQKIATGHITLGAAILFPSAIVGLVASIFAHYYRSRQDDVARSQKIALDTLAKLGGQKRK